MGPAAWCHFCVSKKQWNTGHLVLPAPSYTGWLRGLCCAAVLSWPRSNLSLINFPSCYVQQMAQHIPKSYSMTLYTQENVGFVLVFAFFFLNKYNEENNVLGSLTTLPETARFLLGSRLFLELACWHYCWWLHMLTFMPVLMEIWDLFLKSALCGLCLLTQRLQHCIVLCAVHSFSLTSQAQSHWWLCLPSFMGPFMTF